MKAKIVKVIKTETTEGDGTENNPVRTVVRYWEENGKLIFETDQVKFKEGNSDAD